LDKGVESWVVSDLNEEELRQFVGMLRGAARPREGARGL